MAQPTSVIHDIGYQRYKGPRLGRWYANRSLYEQSLRTAFGIGRGAKAKIFPWMVIGIALSVAASDGRLKLGQPLVVTVELVKPRLRDGEVLALPVDDDIGLLQESSDDGILVRCVGTLDRKVVDSLVTVKRVTSL